MEAACELPRISDKVTALHQLIIWNVFNFGSKCRSPQRLLTAPSCLFYATESIEVPRSCCSSCDLRGAQHKAETGRAEGYRGGPRSASQVRSSSPSPTLHSDGIPHLTATPMGVVRDPSRMASVRHGEAHHSRGSTGVMPASLGLDPPDVAPTATRFWTVSCCLHPSNLPSSLPAGLAVAENKSGGYSINPFTGRWFRYI